VFDINNNIMSKQKPGAKSIEKRNSKAEELKTELPISEKDEVKDAEKLTAKLQKKAAKK